MASPTLRLLGTGNAFLPQGRLHSLLLVDDCFLIDCPPTVLASLRQYNISPATIDTILFTHWHGDHCFGFPFFLLERKYISDREGEKTLNIHLPNGGIERLKNLCELAYPDSLEDQLEKVIFQYEISGTIQGQNGWSFERFEVLHDACVDPHGYLLEHESGFRLMHTGDSGPCEAISDRAPTCDVVVIELGVPDYVDTPHHFSPSKLSTLAQECPEVTFLVTHTWLDDPECMRPAILSSDLPELPSNCIQARDGQSWVWKNSRLTNWK
jgi:ribonuclease BN (tRNA processing enzyme)